MKHIFKKGTDSSKPIFLLLHGTGGNEEDLLPLANLLDPTASVLSVRGNVLEHGMPRFFKRLAEGIFDEEDLKFRTNELYEFIKKAEKQYEFNSSNLIAIGYSNGANIAASVLYHYNDAMQGAALLHPMVPLRNVELPDLVNTNIFISAGVNDPICPKEEAEELFDVLTNANANVEIAWERMGHSISQSEIQKMINWYKMKY